MARKAYHSVIEEKGEEEEEVGEKKKDLLKEDSTGE
jgi:hypothetical protein